MPAEKTAFLWAAWILLAAGLTLPAASLSAAETRSPGRRHLVFQAGPSQEVEVYKIFGRENGPTVMILGGIQGDEPGGCLSADLYADVTLKRGNLIVVPRANFKSILKSSRGSAGDLNRKFQGGQADDSDREIVELIKSLIRESDLFLNLHDGSGYYRPTYESEMANPGRYGQSLIADADAYVHEPTGRVVPLAHYAGDVIERINREIADPALHFRFFNTRTGENDSPYKEQRRSASYYALTQAGIPAFGIEASKQLPSLEMKVLHHNLAVTAFLDLFGVEMDRPNLVLDQPRLGYAVVAVGARSPLAVADGQTLLVPPGETITVVDVTANYDRGLSASLEDGDGRNDIGRPLRIDRPTALILRKDQARIGRINIGFLPEGEYSGGPRLSPPTPLRSARAGRPAVLEIASGSLPEGGETGRADGSGEIGGSLKPAAAPAAAGSGVTGFRLEIDGRPRLLAPGETLEITAGSLVRMVDTDSAGGLPPSVIMNLRGFVPQGKHSRNDGEDRGFTADTGRDMMPAFSSGGRGQEYAINAEQGKTVLASATLKIVKPRLESVTISTADGASRNLKLGGRTTLPAGTTFTVTEIRLAGGLTLSRPRFTLGGRPFPSSLPQTLTMPTFAANLAVFNGETLAGKVTLAP